MKKFIQILQERLSDLAHQKCGVVSLDLCSVVSKVILGLVRLGYGGLGAVT